jgi:nicotinate-nucleotide pyrophosphorylase (carboxylating)
VQSVQEACEAIEAGADVIMLDNMEGQTLIDNARGLKEKYANAGRQFLLESSGGIELGNVKDGHVDDGESWWR